MADGVSAELRLVVAARADFLCEYCLIAEEDTFFGCHVDHIISIKHRGLTKAEN
jgi:HNH endonuclease